MSDTTPFFVSRWPLFAVALFVSVTGCDCDCDKGSALGPPCALPADCDPGFNCVDLHCMEIDPNDDPDSTVSDSLDSLTISPETVNLELDVGEADSSTIFTVVGNRTGGGTIAITNATFTTDVQGPGVIDSAGRFFANGAIGGTVVVTASVNAANGTKTVTATIHITLVTSVGGGDTNDPNSPISRFTNNTPVTATNADAELLYPLAGAVMPQNVQPADVQWALAADGTPCAAADVFRVRLSKPNLTITQYVSNDGNQTNGSLDDHYLVDTALWRALAQTDPDEVATIVVDRWENAQSRVVAGTPIAIRFAKAAITGTVYYWDIDDKTIRAIDDGTSESRELLPHTDSPAGGNHNDPDDGDGCVGCHSVSPTGRYLLANTNFSNYGALYDLTKADLSTANPTPYADGFTASTSRGWRMSSWSPDEDRAVVSGSGGPENLRLIDPFTGMDVPAHDATGNVISLETDSTHPAWARDDSFIAYVSDITSATDATNGNHAWAGQAARGNLRLLAIADSSMDRFGAVTDLVPSSVLNGAAEVGATPGSHGIFYPTWSPDSGYLAFAHGTSSRSDPRDVNPDDWTAPTRAHTSSLYLINRNGTGRVRLSRGCAATQPEYDADLGAAPAVGDRTGLDFQPNFSPFEGGGYYWMSFLSRRPYGNRISGNRGATPNTVHPGQIWVMAIRVNPDGTTDPSEVAYRIPGQIVTHRAVSAFWAPRACRQNGEGCGVGSECCGGDCRPPVGSNGPTVCAPPPPGECRMSGSTCTAREDCCNAATDATVQCEQNVCVNIIE